MPSGRETVSGQATSGVVPTLPTAWPGLSADHAVEGCECDADAAHRFQKVAREIEIRRRLVHAESIDRHRQALQERAPRPARRSSGRAQS